MYEVPRPLLWHAGPDYCKLTRPASNLTDEDVMKVWTCLNRVAITKVEHLEPKEEMRDGYRGHALGKFFVGTSVQGMAMYASGAWSSDLLEARLRWQNAPRLDIQVTLWYQDDIAATLIDASVAATLAHRDQRKLPPYAVQRRATFGDGDTLYIGSRTSDKYVRIYDKMREKKEPEYENSIRFEVELKGEIARMYVHECDDAFPQQEWWYSKVRTILRGYGISLPDCVPETYAVPEYKKEVPTVDSRLAWLSSQVAPTVAKLVASGNVGDAIDALGLAPYFTKSRSVLAHDEAPLLKEMLAARDKEISKLMKQADALRERIDTLEVKSDKW